MYSLREELKPFENQYVKCHGIFKLSGENKYGKTMYLEDIKITDIRIKQDGENVYTPIEPINIEHAWVKKPFNPGKDSTIYFIAKVKSKETEYGTKYFINFCSPDYERVEKVLENMSKYIELGN